MHIPRLCGERKWRVFTGLGGSENINSFQDHSCFQRGVPVVVSGTTIYFNYPTKHCALGQMILNRPMYFIFISMYFFLKYMENTLINRSARVHQNEFAGVFCSSFRGRLWGTMTHGGRCLMTRCFTNGAPPLYNPCSSGNNVHTTFVCRLKKTTPC